MGCDRLMAARLQGFFISFLHSLRAHWYGLWHPLFTDKAGNILFLSYNLSIFTSSSWRFPSSPFWNWKQEIPPQGSTSPKSLLTEGSSLPYTSSVSSAAFRPLFFHLLGEKNPTDVYAIGLLCTIEGNSALFSVILYSHQFYIKTNFYTRTLQTCP